MCQTSQQKYGYFDLGENFCRAQPNLQLKPRMSLAFLAATAAQEAHLSLRPFIRSFVRPSVRTHFVFCHLLNILQHVATFGNIWQLLATFGNFW